MATQRDMLASETMGRWVKASDATLRSRIDYWLNYAFYEGHQWLWTDSARRTVRTLTVDDGKARVVINKIQPNVNTLMGKFLQSDLTFEVPASGTDDSSLTGARLSEYVLEAARVDDGWETVRESTLFNTVLGGVAAVALHPTGENVSVVAGNEEGSAALMQALTIAEFALQPGATNEYDALWWMQRTAVPPEQVQERYGLEGLPAVDTTSGLDPIVRVGDAFEDTVQATSVYVYYERPNSKNLKGRVLHVVAGEVVEQGDWPFKFTNRLNVQLFRASKHRNGWIAPTFVTQARPIQTAYNFVRSNILEHVKLAGTARMLIPDGSIDDDHLMTDLAGEHVPYDPDAGKPEYMIPPQLQRWLTQEPAQLASELDDIMYVHDISRGKAPGDRNSGLALSILTEQDETPLSLISRDQAHGWAALGSMYLQHVAAQKTGAQIATYTTEEGVPIQIRWTGKQLAGQLRVHVPLESTSPYSRAARMSEILNLRQEFPEIWQNMDPAALLRITDFPGLKNVGPLIDADASRAIRENHLMSIGEALLPEDYDDHAKHIAEHNRERKSAKFQSLPLKTQLLFGQHITAHERLAGEEAASQRLINEVVPGAAALPQASAPMGSIIPPALADQGQMPAI